MSTEERLGKLEGAYNHLATKADISDLRGELKTDILATKTDISELKGELKAEIANLKVDLTRWTVGTIIAVGTLAVVVSKFLG